MSVPPSPRLPSIRSQITLLVLACVLPTLIGFGAVLRQFYLHERDRLMQDTRQAARAVAVAVDRELEQSASAGRALATSPSLRHGTLDEFHLQMAGLLGPDFPAAQIQLAGLDGAILQQAGAPLPQPLSPSANAARLARLRVSQRPQLSSLPGPHGPLLAVDVPVIIDGQLRYVLSLLHKADRLAQLLSDEPVSPQQAVFLLDSDGAVLAQVGTAPALVGLPGDRILGRALPTQGAPLLEDASVSGQAVFLGLGRAPVSGTTVALRTPQHQALAQLREATGAIAEAVALLLLAGFSLAWVVGGRVARSARALLAPARALAQGRLVPTEAMSFREADTVAQALQRAAVALQQHQQGLEQLVAERSSQLEKSRAQLETVYASAPLGLSYVDPQLRVVRINDYLAEFNARSVGEHLGRHMGELIADPQVRQAVLADYRTVLETGRPLVNLQRNGYTAASPDAKRHWVVSYYPQLDSAGQVSAIIALLLDITEQKHIEAALQESRRLLRTVVENMPAVIFVKRASDLRYELFNRYGGELLGIDHAHVLGQTDYDIHPPELAARFQQDDRRVLDSGAPGDFEETPLQDAHGRVRHFSTRKVLLRDAQGQATHVLGVALDITERREAEQVLQATATRLAQSEHFMRTVTDNLPGMVAYWDATLRCRFANRYFLEWHDTSSVRLQGALMPEVMGAAEFQAAAPHVQGALAGEPQGFAGKLVWPSGQTSYTWVNYIPDLDQDAKVRGFFVLVSDVTELKETELHLQQLNEELVQARDKAEAASRAKSEFLANMSHEIRTPMNAISGLTRLLQEAGLPPRERGLLAKIQLATNSLLGVVNDVLDFSRVEAGQLQLEQTRFPFEHILGTVSVLLAGSAWDKGIEPVFDIDPAVPTELVGDPMRLQQVLLNLISNAIKFTALGEVVLTVRPLDEVNGRLTLEFAVRDSGIGIEPAQQEQIFAAFSQADSSTSRKYGGTGLGLAISRRLAALMGGAITVDSVPGQGATFRFTCPLQRARLGDSGPRPGDDAVRGLRLLIVDDQPAVQQALARAAQAFGWQAVGVASVEQALARLSAAPAAAAPAFDLLLLDQTLPEGPRAALARLYSAPGLALPPVLMMAPEHGGASGPAAPADPAAFDPRRRGRPATQAHQPGPLAGGHHRPAPARRPGSARHRPGGRATGRPAARSARAVGGRQ